MIDLSIIIVNYKGWDALKTCLTALESFKNNKYSFEVIIVDNCSNDNQLSVFQKRFPNFQFFENKGNYGFSNGNNYGESKAKGEYLLFLNSDIIASESSVSKLLQVIMAHPDISVLSCRKKNNEGKEEKVCRFFLSFKTITGLFRAIYKIKNKRKLSERFSLKKDLIFPDVVLGSVVIMSKENFEDIGGWNDNYWLYCEDDDLCRRVINKGGKVGLCNRVTMIHNHGGTTRINKRTTALTKTEVIISHHVYFSQNFTGIHAYLLHTFFMINNLIFKFIPFVLGTFFFFIEPLNIRRRVYFNLIKYYLNVLVVRTWISPKSINYKK